MPRSSLNLTLICCFHEFFMLEALAPNTSFYFLLPQAHLVITQQCKCLHTAKVCYKNLAGILSTFLLQTILNKTL